MTDVASDQAQVAQAGSADAATLKRMNSDRPAQKVTGSVIAGAIVQILLWVNESRGGPFIPKEVSTSLIVLISFIAGYMTPPGSKEEIIRIRKT